MGRQRANEKLIPQSIYAIPPTQLVDCSYTGSGQPEYESERKVRLGMNDPQTPLVGFNRPAKLLIVG